MLQRTPFIMAVVLALSVGSLSVAASASAAPGDPTITNVSPDAGLSPAGQTVTVTGTSLDTVSSVNFKRVNSTTTTPAASFTAPSPTELTIETPAFSTTAEVTYDLVLGFGPGDQVTAPAAYTSIPTPRITTVRPAVTTAAGGIPVTILTTLKPTNTVTFGGVLATILQDQPASNSIVVQAPPHAPGVVDITIASKRGYTITQPAAFTYTGITDVTPNVGSIDGGTDVKISGTFSTPTQALVGDAPLLNPTITDTAITGTVPAHAAGSVDVTVESSTPANNTTLTDGFRYLTPPAPTSLTPAEGDVAGGTTVTVNGTGFTGTTAVTFGGVPATDVSVASDTELTAVAPAHTAGPVDVEITNPAGLARLSAAYTYVEAAAPAPAPTGLTPPRGDIAGGTTVTVNGTGFTRTTAVSFGGVLATDVTVVSDTELTAVTPAHAAGAVDVTVTGPGGDGVLRAAFTYTTIETPGDGGTTGPGTGPGQGIGGGTGIGVGTETGSNGKGSSALAFTGTHGLGFAAGAALLALLAGAATLTIRRRLAH
jgi:hypothetical protein